MGIVNAEVIGQAGAMQQGVAAPTLTFAGSAMSLEAARAIGIKSSGTGCVSAYQHVCIKLNVHGWVEL